MGGGGFKAKASKTEFNKNTNIPENSLIINGPKMDIVTKIRSSASSRNENHLIMQIKRYQASD